MSAPVEVRQVTKRFDGASSVAVDDVSFTVEKGSFTCLLGPSGSGKSTILGIVAGLVGPDAGEVLIDGQSMQRVPTHRRPVTLLQQSAQLFPFLSVADNVAFGLQVRGVGTKERRAKASSLLGAVGLAGFEARSVDGLSGGEQQRVALARALAVQPQVMLLDEPLASLDPPVRREMQDVLIDVHRQFGTTTIFVTHDMNEAMALGDQLVIVERGSVRAIGAPAVLFERPSTIGVARLLGFDNVLQGSRTTDGLQCAIGMLRVNASNAVPTESSAVGARSSIWVIRPEHVRLERREDNTFDGVVIDCRYRGMDIEVRLDIDGIALTARVPSGDSPARGSRVAVFIDPTHLREVVE